mmetsp:Transcript_28488/g.87164  ORF Transcript_28488/g.87164 Transcript_28488/m.87164 type:complete len:93 (+) Transcript_28488:194-472(+)
MTCPRIGTMTTQGLSPYEQTSSNRPCQHTTASTAHILAATLRKPERMWVSKAPRHLFSAHRVTDFPPALLPPSNIELGQSGARQKAVHTALR